MCNDNQQVPESLLNKACELIAREVGEQLPFKYRGIYINRKLIQATLEVLNAAPGRTLPQNCRQHTRHNTPDGLDRRIKERLNLDLRTANIVSDLLGRAGVVEVVEVETFRTHRKVKGTRLKGEWSW